MKLRYLTLALLMAGSVTSFVAQADSDDNWSDVTTVTTTEGYDDSDVIDDYGYDGGIIQGATDVASGAIQGAAEIGAGAVQAAGNIVGGIL